MNTNLRPSGIEGLGDMAWGTHFCLFYETKEDLLDFFIPFFQAGLEHQEFCLCIASEPLIAEEAERAMRKALPDFEQYLAEGQIEITPHTDWYLKEGRFDEQRVLQGWTEKLEQAVSKGFSGLRFAANILLEKRDWESFARYEGKLEETLRDLRIEGLCAYNLNRYSAANVLDIIRHHQFTLARRDGTWETLEGGALKHAHEEVLKLSTELEHTAQLAAANEQLTGEIAERKQAEALLHAREQEFRAFVENAPDQIIRYDKEFRRTYVNPAVSAAYGLPKEAFIGKPVGSILEQLGLTTALDQVTTIRRQIKSVFDTGKATEYEVTFPLPGGRRTFWTRMYPEFDPNGVVINVLGISRDITERKQAEAAIGSLLQISEKLHATLDIDALLDSLVIEAMKLIDAEIGWSGLRTEEGMVCHTHITRDLQVVPFKYFWPPGVGLPGWVLVHKVPYVMNDAQSDKMIIPEIRERFGVNEAIDTPILDAQGEVIGFFEVNNKKNGAGFSESDVEKLVAVSRIASIALQNAMSYGILERAEKALRESEEKFSVAFRSSPIGLVIATMDGKYVEVNQAFCDLLGYSRQDLLGKTAIELEIFNEETRQAWVEAVEREGGVMTNVELSFRVRNGTSRTTLSSVETIILHGIPHRLSTVLDITERKGAEETIRKSEQVLREAESLGHTGSWEQNLVTGEIFNTEENLRLFFGDDHSKGADFEDYAEVVHPDDREYVMQRRVQLLTERGPSDIEYRVVWPDGSVHVIFGRATVVYDELGQALRVYGTNVDITERKQMEEALRISEKNFRTLADKSLEGIQLYQGGTSVYANAAMTALMGYTQEELKAMSIEEHIALVHPLDRAIAVERARKRQAGQEVPASLEIRVLTKAGATRWVQGFTNEIEYNGQPAILSTAIDITERKRAEEDTKRQATRAETLARIAARLNKQLDLDAVIHAVCEEAINTFKVSQATMSLYDKKSDLLIYAGGINIPPEYTATMEPITRSRFDDFLRAMGPIMVVPDIQSLPDVPNAEFSSRLDVRTVVTTAMLRDQELVGALVLGVNGHVREFDQDELTSLKAISDQAAQAIANALLLRAANEQHEQLRALSAKLVDAQETERQALTTELHDRVGQNLTGLSINLQNMKAWLSNESAKTLATKFDDAQALVEHITRQIRDIMAELHPAELEDYGLAVALETYAERAASRGNLELIADLPDLAPPPLPSDVHIALFRAAQEAIHNVLKHADATQLEVSLEESAGRIRLRVEDDGQGFEPDALTQKEAQTWGLKIMRERIESIGGKVQIESEPEEGTRVTFEIERPS